MSLNNINYGIEIGLGLVAILIVSAFLFGRYEGRKNADQWYAEHPIIESGETYSVGACELKVTPDRLDIHVVVTPDENIK